LLTLTRPSFTSLLSGPAQVADLENLSSFFSFIPAVNTPAEQKGTPYFPATIDYPTSHHPFLTSPSAPSDTSLLRFSNINHQQSYPRYGSASANTSSYPSYYAPAPTTTGQMGPSVLQNPMLPPPPRLTGVTHSPLTSTNGPPLQIPGGGQHSSEQAMSTTSPLDGVPLYYFPPSPPSASSGASSPAATAPAAGSGGAVLGNTDPHNYLTLHTSDLQNSL
jgi:hypothetical protein